jgi:hypothetical protein
LNYYFLIMKLAFFDNGNEMDSIFAPMIAIARSPPTATATATASGSGSGSGGGSGEGACFCFFFLSDWMKIEPDRGF